VSKESGRADKYRNETFSIVTLSDGNFAD